MNSIPILLDRNVLLLDHQFELNFLHKEFLRMLLSLKYKKIVMFCKGLLKHFVRFFKKKKSTK